MSSDEESSRRGSRYDYDYDDYGRDRRPQRRSPSYEDDDRGRYGRRGYDESNEDHDRYRRGRDIDEDRYGKSYAGRYGDRDDYGRGYYRGGRGGYRGDRGGRGGYDSYRGGRDYRGGYRGDRRSSPPPHYTDYDRYPYGRGPPPPLPRGDYDDFDRGRGEYERDRGYDYRRRIDYEEDSYRGRRGRYSRSPSPNGDPNRTPQKRMRPDDRRYDRSPPPAEKATETRESGEVKATDVKGRLQSLITRVGDKGASAIPEQLEALTDVLLDDLESHFDHILLSLMKCVMELAVKTPIYGTLVGLVNLKNTEFGARAVSEAANLLEIRLQEGDWIRAKLLIRFFGELMNNNVVPSSDIMGLLNKLASVATTESNQEYNQGSHRQDCYAYLVIASLPWVGKELDKRKRDDLNDLMTKLDNYMSKRSRRGVSLLRVFQDQPAEDYLDVMWKQVQFCRTNGKWNVDSILKPYQTFESRLTKRNQQHKLPEINIPPESENGYKILKSHIDMFRLQDAWYTAPDTKMDDTEETGFKIPDINPIDRMVTQEYIEDILFFFNPSHTECVKQLLGHLPVQFPYEYLLVETIFSQLFHLPVPPFRLIFYGVIFLDLCKTNPNITTVLAYAIMELFDRVDVMDAECFDRFVEWFAYHLSNLDFKWSWEAWDEVLELPQDSPKVLFVKEALHRCVRLSFIDRVRGAIPPSFAPLLPVIPVAYYKFGRPDAENKKLATEVLDAAKRTPPAKVDEVRQILNKFGKPEQTATAGTETKPEAGNNDNNNKTNNIEGESGDVEMQPVGEQKSETPVATATTITTTETEQTTATGGGSSDALDANEKKLEILIHVILLIGSKSFSHLLTTIEHYNELIKELNTSPETRLQIIKAVAEFWKNSPQHVIITLDKLMSYMYVDLTSVIYWIFSEETIKDFHRGYVWEILRMVVEKSISRRKRLEDQLASVEADLRQLDRSQAPVVGEEDKPVIDAAQEAQAERNHITLAAANPTLKKEEELTNAAHTLRGLVDEAATEQKEVLLRLFQRFSMTLNEYIPKFEAGEDVADFSRLWPTFALGHLKEVARKYKGEMSDYFDRVESMIFSAEETHRKITDIIAEAKYLPTTQISLPLRGVVPWKGTGRDIQLVTTKAMSTLAAPSTK